MTAFGNTQISKVSAGSGGYVAVGDGGPVWVSNDGTSWQPVDLTAPAFANSKIDDGVAFAGGYVLAGSTAGHDGCNSQAGQMSAVWWSANGSQWTRDQLPPAETSAGSPDTYSVCRITDHSLLALGFVWGSGGTEVAWTSSDGKTWTAAPDLNNINTYAIVTDGKHTIVTDTAVRSTFLKAFDDQLKLAPLADVGDTPVADAHDEGHHSWSYAIGPTGVVVTRADHLWIGLPSAG